MGILLIVAVALAAVLAAVLALTPRWRQSAPRVSRVLRLAAVAVAVGTSLAVLPLLIADQNGTAAIALIVLPPVVITLIAAAAPLLDHPVAPTVVTWIMTVLMFAYVIVYGLGVGFFYAPAALLLLVAALTRTRMTDRSRSEPDVAARS